MFTWILIILYSSLCASDPAYECGPHGKFEYCIDGIPGCVIGCHCHPGYYFDTDTKICEPNVKLSHDYRRHYMPIEPTRVQHIQSITLATPATELSTKDAIDAKVDEIANDADDLGDWLYNQFFKTIENQVMNKTNGDSQQLTRRSGVQIKKPVRRSHKHMRSRKSKKPKKKNLKSKLLRITEDDSLFRSSSESGDDDTSDTSGSNGSSEAESDTSSDDKRDKKDDDHEHKKIVIFNKKPRPPLPSFIFLPNMDTPFFPPIGLPPPAVPMYPMIPVPPVMGPMYPYPPPVMPPNGAQDPNNNGVTNGVATNAPTTHAVAPTTHAVAPSEATPDNEPPQTSAPEDLLVKTETETESDVGAETATAANEPSLRSRQRIRAGARSGTRGNLPIHNASNKQKLIQKLRQKIMRQKKLDNYRAEQQMEPDSPIVDENFPADMIPTPGGRKVNIERPAPVDFKYLTELIHKMDPNGTARGNLVSALAEKAVPNPAPTLGRRTNYDLGQAAYQASNLNQNLIGKNNTRRQRINMDDSYYADLGQQIASMIKNIDMSDNHHIDVEIEPNQETPRLHPVFNENSYGARSYWERSIRSPIKYVGPHKENFSEEHLFKLENEVETAASTIRNLNLQELETIIFNMNKPKTPPRKANYLPTHVKKIIIEPARVMFNLNNMLPQNNNTHLIKTIETQFTTELPENSLRKSTLKSVLFPDVFFVSNMRNFNYLTTEPQIIYNNPYFIQPTRKPNSMPVIGNQFEQPRYNPDQSRYNQDQSRYNPDQLRYTNQLRYNTDQSNYNPDQTKYTMEQSKYNHEQLKHILEQLKYNSEQARYQNNEVPYNLPIPTPSSKFLDHNAFANSYNTNDFNMTKMRYNIKPQSYNPPPNIYYYSTNNKNNWFEKPTLPIHLQSLTRKIKPYMKKFEPYSYFQHQFQHQFDNDGGF